MGDPATNLKDTWFRCTSRKREPLSTRGALLAGGRYNAKGVAALYLASSPNLAVSEHLGLGALYGVTRFPPRLLVSIDVDLTRVLDLTAEDVLAQVRVKRDDLVGPYSDDPSHPSITQLIAQLARAQGFEAIMAPSAVEPGQENLVIFPENLSSPESVRVVGFDDHLSEERQGTDS
jgi:RES domain-containing protein